ncbi:hypothetical protein G7K71_07965 [Desulfofundulus sp. TPOSR]|uniref:hypothetical protein n=1 Tax=Desulfofundulus sp. TPOSR TaxID=2714340 RepID=UPI0014095750|nr:hypothetical protein [Desulfofundulus sp. TPOSR]NHM26918.1 hypothetical protein [Desulfofundulus sp. TPOSR]
MTMRANKFLAAVLAIFLAAAAILPLPAAAQEAAVEVEYRDDITVNHPYYVEQLPGGNLLMTRVGHLSPAVVEVTPAGQEVWSYQGVQAAAARRLANGNTLIADSGAPGRPFVPRVIEVNPAGRVVWEYRLPSPARAPRYAQRLSGGNTLITLPYQIIEVTPDKRVVWSYGWGRPVPPGTPGHLANPVQAVRLPNGHTLIVDQGFTGGRVLEIDAKKQVVWQVGDGTYGPPPAIRKAAPDATGNNEDQNGKTIVPGRDGATASTTAATEKVRLKRPTGAVRLPNGNTLIADAGTSTLLEVSPDRQIISSWSWRGALAGLPVMNQWLVTPLDQSRVIVPLTLTSSKSRVLVVTSPALLPYGAGFAAPN